MKLTDSKTFETTIFFILFSLIHVSSSSSIYTSQPSNQSVQLRSTASFECSFVSNTSVYILWLFMPSSSIPQSVEYPKPHVIEAPISTSPIIHQQLILFTGENRFKAPPNMKVQNIISNGVVVGSRLVIERVGVEDDGRYSCSISGGSADLTATLDVKVQPDNVRIMTDESRWSEGERVWLNCSTKGGNPHPKLEWLRNGKSIKEGWISETGNEGSSRPRSIVAKEMLVADGQKFGKVSNNLLYVLSHRDHMSNFTCVALPYKPIINQYNPLSQASRTILVEFSPIINMGPLANLVILEHSNLLINCSIRSFPITSSRDVTWYYGDAPIANSGFEYTVRNVTREITGRYGCGVGHATEHIHVDVNYPPIIHVNISLEQSYPRSDLFNIQKGSKNYLEENDYDYSKILVTAVEGQEISMDCFCDSKPLVKESDIKWKKRLKNHNGSSIKPPQDLRQFPIRISHAGIENIGSRLLFRPVNLLDQWTYVCLCSNYLQPYNLSPFNAYARKEVSLNILYKPGKAEITLPNIALVGKKAVLRCSTKIPGNPPCEYKWYRGGKLEGTGPSLVIHQTLLSHSGQYTCIPSNNIGFGSNASVHFQVLEPPSLLSFRPSNTSLIEASLHQTLPIQLACSIKGSPPPKITWFKDDQSLENIEQNSDNDRLTSAYRILCTNQTFEEFSYNVTCVLYIQGSNEGHSIEVRDGGNYSCVASNEVSSAKKMKEVMIAVKFPPEVTSKPSQALQIGVSGSISFVIHSYPEPNVQWFNRSLLLEQKNSLNRKNESSKEMFEVETTTASVDVEKKNDISSSNFKQRYTTELLKTGSSSYVAILHLNKVTRYELGKYSIKVRNDIGEISSTVDVVPAVVPETPFNLTSASVSWHSVFLNWEEGSDGGLQQQFIVETDMLSDGTLSQTVVVNRSSLTLKGLIPNENYNVRVYSENKVGRSNASNTITFKTKELKINSPKTVHYSDDEKSIILSLPTTLYNLIPPYVEQSDPKIGQSKDWGEFCAKVEVYNGEEWKTEYPCVREFKIKLKGQEVRVTAVRVSICSEERPDICSEEKYSSSDIVSTEVMIAVGCICGLVVGVLLIIVVCLSAKRIKEKKKRIKTKVTVQSEISKNNTANFWDSSNYTKATYNIDESPAGNGWLNGPRNNNDIINTNNNNNNYSIIGVSNNVNNSSNYSINNNSHSLHSSNGKFNIIHNNNNNLDLLNIASTNNLLSTTSNISNSSLIKSHSNTVSYMSHPNSDIPHSFHCHTFTPNHCTFNHSHLSPRPIFTPPIHDTTPHFSPYISEDEHNSTMELIHTATSPNNLGGTFKERAPSENKKKIIHEVIV